MTADEYFDHHIPHRLANMSSHGRSRIKLALLTIFLAVGTWHSALEGHIFTGANGVIIEGEPISVNNGILTIRTQGGKEAQLSTTGLNPVDQAYVNDWRQSAEKYSFNINLIPRRAQGATAQTKKATDTSGQKISSQSYYYHVQVINMTSEPIPATKMNFRIFTVEATSIGSKSHDPPQPAANGSIDLPELAPRGSYTFDTGNVELESWQPPPGYHFTSGGARYHKMILAGFEGTISLGSKDIWSYSTPGVRKK